MIFFALGLGMASLMLSAIFSGTETAFYRASKLRLKLDALAGDVTAKRSIWFANNPGFFIATLLVGNNVANYGVSVAMVLFIGCMFPHHGGMVTEIAGTLILTPFLFVYGEMFPKYICLNTPNRMLRFLLPIVTIACRLFSPVTVLLWGINTITSRFFGNSQEKINLSLGRGELSGILIEGKNTGILSDTQRRLAEGIFNCSDRLLKDVAQLPAHFPAITREMKPESVLSIARKRRLLALPVYESDADRQAGDLPVGYVRVIDLEMAVRNLLDEPTRQLAQLLQTELPLRGTVELSAEHSLLTGLILLQTQRSAYGCVVNKHRRCLGFVSADQLRNILLNRQEDIEQGYPRIIIQNPKEFMEDKYDCN